jgi:peptide-methionine (R)-S-oxide reductase
MDRRGFLVRLAAAGAVLLVFPMWARTREAGETVMNGEAGIETLNKPLEEWRELLDEDAFGVLFRERTERAFSSPLNDEKRAGTYVCAACFLPLFLSDAKFDSGTGWPSFFQPIEGRIGTRRDFRLIIPRIEYHCIRCGGHQGHVFNDGPAPTGQRWCNNGLALRFVPQDEPLPALRD